jgi:hypothetical protein
VGRRPGAILGTPGRTVVVAGTHVRSPSRGCVIRWVSVGERWWEGGVRAATVVLFSHQYVSEKLDSQVLDDPQHLTQQSEADSLSAVEQNDSQASLVTSREAAPSASFSEQIFKGPKQGPKARQRSASKCATCMSWRRLEERGLGKRKRPHTNQYEEGSILFVLKLSSRTSSSVRGRLPCAETPSSWN